MIKRIKHIKELWQSVSKAISKEVAEEIEYVNDGNGKGLVDYWTHLYPAYTDYSLSNANKAQDKVLASLTGSGPLTQKHIDKALKIVEDQYQTGIDKLEKLDYKYAPAVYEYYKLKLPVKFKKAEDVDTYLKGNKEVRQSLRRQHYTTRYKKVVKALIKKATEYTDDITGIDTESIEQLTTSNIVWIYNHASDNATSKLIARDLEKYKLEGSSIYESAEKLRATYAEYTPEEFAKHFGEKYYWKSFVRTQTQRIKSFSNINSMIEGGYEKYKWVTRGDPCPICEEFDGRVYNVSDAKDHMDDYLAAGQDGDTEEMKAAMPWIPLDDIQDYPGMMPQIHGGCVCEIITILEL